MSERAEKAARAAFRRSKRRCEHRHWRPVECRRCLRGMFERFEVVVAGLERAACGDITLAAYRAILGRHS